ncbi:N-acetyltransferase-like protein [Aulographum hederae CBS 113979]|uniref:N-acetyltransferase-like protein n=1 Tax=Aulographum hederae CBS 113979 TaxID=1176131 RepID=A0A6G1HH85_9PEZI|nr:N-acetyltransferase-like protein [Aulographum hederae CBS 113979]
MADEATVRLATREDVPSILSMIRDLAIFENALDAVEATEEMLLNTLSFAPSSADSSKPMNPADASPGYAKTFLLMAQPENTIAGMALYYTTYSTWQAKPGVYLEDLYIKPEFRRRGYATVLLQELAKEAERIGGGRLEWSCLKWNENALKFYEGESVGARQMEEWTGLRVDGNGLTKLACKR